MHDADGMCRRQRMANLHEDEGEVRWVDAPRPRDVGCKVFTLEQLHQQPRCTRLLVHAPIDHLDYVFASNRRAEQRLSVEAVAKSPILHEVPLHDLERALQLREVARLNCIHSSFADEAQDLEFTGEYS